MKNIALIRNRHFYRIWFVNLIKHLILSKKTQNAVAEIVENKSDKYPHLLFKIGAIKPVAKLDPESRFLEAHLKGLKLVSDQIRHFTEKYPELAKAQLLDPRWIRLIVDWADVLANGAAAYCNANSDDESNSLGDAERCTRAWLDYNDAVIAHGMAQDNLDDCLFQNSNPPIVVETSDSSPFEIPPVDPCLWAAMEVVTTENNMNAAWDDISTYC